MEDDFGAQEFDAFDPGGEAVMPVFGKKDEFGANGDRDRHLSVGCIFKSQAQAAAENDAAFGKG